MSALRYRNVYDGCENEGMVETVMSPGYSGCNRAITECASLHICLSSLHSCNNE